MVTLPGERAPRASGRGRGTGRSVPFDLADGCELPGLTHFDLLNHPSVYARLRTWLNPRLPSAGPP